MFTVSTGTVNIYMPKTIFRFVPLLFLYGIFILPSPLAAQEPGNMYREIESQIRSLFNARGLSDQEIDVQLQAYRDQGILSDDELARLLWKLYPENAGIGVLLFYFNNDSLRRVFLKPGKVIDQSTIALKKQELLQLNTDLNQVLALNSKSMNRLPRQRGVIVTNEKASPGLTYKGLIQKLTKLLLPASFDSRYRHLLIIPALNIGTLPFHLLTPYNDGKMLIDQCSFTIVPTLLDLIGLRTKIIKNAGGDVDIYRAFDTVRNKEISPRNYPLRNVLFVSNPAYPTDSGYIFPDLPGAKKEIDNARVFASGYKLLEGKAATKDSVLKYIRKYDAAYFATHGIANEISPMEKSFLVLSGKDPYLTARNIMELRKKDLYYEGFPEMIILSACQTGLGRAMEAGVAGLARSFLLAGSHHIIMSLWNVDDNATAFLMNRFLYHLEQPGPFTPAEPLRKALLDTRKRYPHPSQWASFSHFGIDY